MPSNHEVISRDGAPARQLCALEPPYLSVKDNFKIYVPTVIVRYT